jgi:hypothetical protein
MILPNRKKYFRLLLLLAAGAICRNCLAQETADHLTGKDATQFNASIDETQEPQEQPKSEAQKPAQAPLAKSESSSQQQTQPADKSKDDPGTVQPNQIEGTSKDRLFFTLPNFLTLENANLVPPLTTGQKFKVVARSSFDYVQYPWFGFLAGVSQAENSEPGYGQGAAGYGKRYGAAMADGTLENFITSAVFPSVLRQDPRFFQSGKGGFWHRTGYAISRIFVTRTDSGHQQVNYSEIVGSALSAGISTYSYHPHADKTLPNALSVWGTQVGYDTITYVVKEFWPDIRRKIRGR